MSGFVAIHRELFEHPVFERDALAIGAWVWLIGKAEWKASTVYARSGKKRELIELTRGQLSHAERYLAEAWGCSRQKARGLISMFEADGMLTVNRGHIQQVITICNYDKWQDVSEKSEPQPDHNQTAIGPKNNNLTIDDDHGGGAEAHEVAVEVGKLCGFEGPLDWPIGWYGAPMRVVKWFNSGWPRDLIMASCRAQIARKRDGPPSKINYFEKGIARAFAEQSSPVPVAKILPQETIEAKRATTENLSTVARRLAGSSVDFGPRPGSAGAARDAPDSPHVRLLSKG